MNKKFNNAGVYLVVGITLIASVLWSLSPSVSFSLDISSIFLNLGKLLGIIGIVLFALSLILSARLPIFESWFNGLNKVYINHSNIGQLAFVAILFHPIFLLLDYASGTFGEVISFFSLGSGIARDCGVISLYLMVILLVITLYARFRYHIWKWTHKFMGLAFIFGAVHLYLIPSDTSSFPPLKIYLLVLSGLAIIAYLYRTVFGFILVKRHPYKIIANNKLNASITELVLAPLSKPMAYQAGQFVFMQVAESGISKEEHPFSIASGDNDPTISIIIKKLGDYTKLVPDFPVGTRVHLEGPFGKFSFQNSPYKHQIWIGGGVGITPFLSMIRSLPDDSPYYIDLYYAVRNQEEAIYIEELTRGTLSRKIKVIPHYSDTDGFITVEHIASTSQGLQEKGILMCAPPLMIQSLHKDFIKSGVKTRAIISEEFNF